jgi:stage V sporulation protein G
MDITEVRVYPVNEEKLKAYVTITLDNCFVVRDLKVINGNTGLFIAMPAKRRKDGTFKDIAHPLNVETRQRMERVILAEYDKELKRVAAGAARLVSRAGDSDEGRGAGRGCRWRAAGVPDPSRRSSPASLRPCVAKHEPPGRRGDLGRDRSGRRPRRPRTREMSGGRPRRAETARTHPTCWGTGLCAVRRGRRENTCAGAKLRGREPSWDRP